MHREWCHPAQELLTRHGLPLEEPLVGFLLSVGTSAEVHDYLQARTVSGWGGFKVERCLHAGGVMLK